MRMYNLKSGRATLPKGFKDMMEAIGKKDHIKSNRDTLRRTLMKEEERRQGAEDDEDLLTRIREKSQDGNLTGALPPNYQDKLDSTMDGEETDGGSWTLTGAYRLQNEMHAVRYLYRRKISKENEQPEAAPGENASAEQLRTFLAKQKQDQEETALENMAEMMMHKITASYEKSVAEEADICNKNNVRKQTLQNPQVKM